MHDSDNFDRLFIGEVDDKVEPDGPESERRHEQVFAHVPELWAPG